jgi:hypothetical protein
MAACTSAPTRVARRNIDCRRTDFETGIAKHLFRRGSGFMAQISQQDVFACANAASDNLTDRSGSANDNNIGHGKFLLRPA